MEEKEMEEMSLPQRVFEHEKRITILETSYGMFSQKIEGVDKRLESMETSIRSSNDEQKVLLNTLINHHLSTNKMKLSSFWKFLISLTGAGGLVGTVIYAAIQFFN